MGVPVPDIGSPSPATPTAIVTGADRGMGKAAALALARDGFNTGVGLYSSVLDTSEANWQRILDTNLNGAFRCLQQAARPLVDGGMARMGAQASSHLPDNSWRAATPHGTSRAG